MNPLLHGLWQTLVGIVAPESLAVEKTREKARENFDSLAERRNALQPGDLIIVRTPGTFYKFFRGLAGHKFDHLAIVLNDGMFLHVGPPTVRLLPVELLLDPTRSPVVYRPRLNSKETQELIQSLYQLVGVKYDTVRVYSFIARLAFSKYLRLGSPVASSVEGQESSKNVSRMSKILQQFRNRLPSSLTSSSSSSSSSKNSNNTPFAGQQFICTDAILDRLAQVSSEFRNAVQKSKLFDFSTYRSWSINDVVKLEQYFPRLLARVHLPPVNSLNQGTQPPRAKMFGPTGTLPAFFLSVFMQVWKSSPAFRSVVLVALLTRTRLPLRLLRAVRYVLLYMMVKSLSRDRKNLTRDIRKKTGEVIIKKGAKLLLSRL